MVKKKILILNDGSSYENWGIKACIDGFKNILEKTHPEFEIDGVPHSYMHKKYSWEPIFLKRKIFNDNSRIAKKFLMNIIFYQKLQMSLNILLNFGFLVKVELEQMILLKK